MPWPQSEDITRVAGGREGVEHRRSIGAVFAIASRGKGAMHTDRRRRPSADDACDSLALFLVFEDICFGKKNQES